MRWGVRRRRDGTVEKSGRTAKSRGESRKESSDYKESRALKSKDPSTLSNAELKKLNERLNLERNFSQLTNPPQKNKIETGHDYVKQGVNMAKTASEIYNLYNSPAGKAARKLIFSEKK